MNSRFHRGLFAILVSIGALGAGSDRAPAQGARDSLRLSLDECVTLAITRGEDMRTAEADYRSARAVYLQARSTAFPQVSLSGSYSRQIKSIFEEETSQPGVEPFSPDTNNTNALERIRYVEKHLPTAAFSGLGALFSGTGFGSKNSYVATLTVQQKLIEGGQIWGSIAAAKHAIRSVENARTDKREDVVLTVREAYMTALLAERGVRIAQLGLEQAESQLQRVQLRRDAGEASEFALLQAQVQRDNQTPIVLEARTRREVAYLELARLSNLPSNVHVRLTTPLLDDVAVPPEPAVVDTIGLVEAALRNPGIIALQEEVEARRHAITVAGSGKWPTVSAFANYSEEAFPSDMFPKSGDWKQDAKAGVTVNWSLFDGFKTKGQIQQSKADRTKAEIRLEQARKVVREAVIQSCFDLVRAAADLLARSRTVEYAQRAYELASLRFNEGASDLLEVEDARIGHQIAQTNEARARYDYFVSLARLERYSGRPVFTSAVPASQP